jgi:hypothetical protein
MDDSELACKPGEVWLDIRNIRIDTRLPYNRLAYFMVLNIEKVTHSDRSYMVNIMNLQDGSESVMFVTQDILKMFYRRVDND